MISVGQTLWGVNKETDTEETVNVIEISNNYFRVEYKGLKRRYPFSALNTIFFAAPQRTQNAVVVRTCDNCFLRYNGTCTSLSENVCEDFRAKQMLPQDEIDNWPKYGDATAYKLGDKKHFK